MNVIIIHCHPIEDGRVKKHIKYLISKNINVFVVHFSICSINNHEEIYSPLYGEKGININYFWGSDIKHTYERLFVLLNYYRFFGAKIFKDTIKSLKILGCDMANKEQTIIHVHDPMLLPLAKRLVLSEYFKMSKIVYDRHEVYEKIKMFKYFGTFGFRSFELFTKNYVSGVIGVSDYHVPSIRKFFPKAIIKTVQNYPSINEYNLQNVKTKLKCFDVKSQIKFVYIGSLANSFDRDIDFLIKIAENLLTRYSNCIFYVGGNNQDKKTEDKLQLMCNKFPNKFYYLGYVNRQKTIEITQNAQFGFLLIKPNTSYWVRTSPNKVFEYLICGTVPIIRADVDHYNLLKDCSLFFSREADEEKIIEEIVKMLGDPQKIKKLMIKAKDASNYFIWESVAKNYIDLYCQIL